MLRPNLEQVRRPEPPSTNIDQDMCCPNIDTVSSLTSLTSMVSVSPQDNSNAQYFDISGIQVMQSAATADYEGRLERLKQIAEYEIAQRDIQAQANMNLQDSKRLLYYNSKKHHIMRQ